ncbi:MAG: methyltransferase domain-containing protein [Solirubrobacteraceae bacterium]
MARADLPPRYHTRWRQPYEDNIEKRLQDGMTILDIGAGRHPTLPPEARPLDVTYIGLDVSREEMVAAGAGAYHETYVVDITHAVPELIDTIDLAVSWQVFEHVKPLDAALNNIHRYLRPGGTLVSMFSGRWSAFGVVNQLIPHAIGKPIVERVMKRRAANQPVFPAYYDRCSARQLRVMTAAWQSVEIVPFFRGATYFNSSAILTRFYLWWEAEVHARNAANLATHYLLIAHK